METITPTELAKAASISLPYASQIMSGKRIPPRSLAIHIFRQTDWRHPMLTSLTDEQMAVLEQVERWTPRTASAA